jgi:septal ring factor EnvC (AmiA/AmiB activator)
MRSLARLSRGGLVALALASVVGDGEDAVRARLSRARTLRLVIHRDVNELDVFRRAVRRVEAEAATVRREAAALSTLAMMHAIERQALDALEDELQPTLAHAERRRQRMLRGYELRRDERDVLASILAYRSELGRGGVALLERGRLARPVRGDVVGPYGTSKDAVLGVQIERTGVELRARRGEPVVAPADGDVVMVSDLPGFDRVVVIDHGEGVRSMLARLTEVRVHVGARVAGGQRLARVAPKTLDDGLGTTVYLEVRHAERAIDPTRLLVGGTKRRGRAGAIDSAQGSLAEVGAAVAGDDPTPAQEPYEVADVPPR